MNVVIREALDSDIEALIRCHKRFMEHHIAGDQRFTLRPGAEEKWNKQIADTIGNWDTLVLVAEVNAIMVGCAYTLIKSGGMDFGPEKIGYLCDVFVEPGYRRLGIARRFLSSAVIWLREKGIHTIEASWSVHSAEARNAWPSLGFVPISVSGQMEF
jgi:GNAT superfamily N-acetyltransferase